MKKFSLVLALLMLVSTSTFAQFMNAGNGNADTTPAGDFKGWNGFRVSYDMNTASVDVEDADDYDFNGFSLGYVKAFSVSKKLPLFIETGLGVNFNKWSEEESDEVYYDGYYFDVTDKISITTWGLTIPINLAYKYTINDKFSVTPYTGLYLRANLTAKGKEEVTVSGYGESESEEEEYDLFDKDDVGEDGTWNRVNFGWQIGATVQYNRFNVGVRYGLDFNEIAEKIKMSGFSISLGVNF